MQLKRQRKKLRTQHQNTENVYKKTVITERIKLIKKQISDKLKENRSSRIIKVGQKIKSNVDYRVTTYETESKRNMKTY